MQEVPALLNLPQNQLGTPVWIIMTGTTTGAQGYNRFFSKIVPLTSAQRSVDLIPFMVVSPRARFHLGKCFWHLGSADFAVVDLHNFLLH